MEKQIETYFRGIREKVIEIIDGTNQELLAAVAWFTDKEIYDSIIQALYRKIKVTILLVDDSNNRDSPLNFDFLINNGATICFISEGVGIMHHKFCISDRKFLMMGSYNWTYSGSELNKESMILTQDNETIEKFLYEFLNLLENYNLNTNYSNSTVVNGDEVRIELEEEINDPKIEPTNDQVLIPFYENSKWGYLDLNGKKKIKPKYVWAYDFKDGLARVKLKINNEEKYGFINEDGKEIIPCRFNEAYNFSEGLAGISIGKYQSINKWGFINKEGRIVIEAKYDEVSDFSEGLAGVTLITYQDNLSSYESGFINRKGELIIPFNKLYLGTGNYHQGLASVYCLNLWDGINNFGFIDKFGNLVISHKYNNVGDFSFGLAPVQFEDKYGVIDKSGKQIVPFIYDYIDNFYEKLAKVKLDKLRGYLDITGNIAIPLNFDSVLNFSEGLALVKIKKKLCYINIYGELVLNIKYNKACNFHNGVAKVYSNKNVGYINRDGKEIIPCKYYEPKELFSYDNEGRNFLAL